MGSGFALDGIKRATNNHILKQMRRVRFEEMRDAVLTMKAKYHIFHDRNSLSKKRTCKI